MGLASTAAKLLASLDLDTKPFEAGARRVGASLNQMESRFGRIGSIAKQGASTFANSLKTIGTFIIAPAVVAGFKASITAASDLSESVSKVNVVFGESASTILKWAETSATALGSTRQQALEAAGTYGNLFKAFGIGNEKATEWSMSLVQLATDLASFNNTSVDDALNALRSGLSGETEPLKRFGIALSVDRMKAELLNMGIKDLGTTLTPAQKAMAAYAIIMKDSTLAQGDFQRTSEGLANQQRILKANLGNTAATIGTALLPKVNELVKQFNTWFLGNQGAITQFADQLPGMFEDIVGIVRSVPWSQIGDALKIAGAGAKVLLGAFNAMPEWVKTAIITGWGLNKLTGGALGSIVGELGKGLIKGVLGMNAGVVNINAGAVRGGGVPGGSVVAPGAKGGLGLASKLFLVGEAIGLVAAVLAVKDAVADGATQQAKEIGTAVGERITTNPTFAELNQALAGIDEGLAKLDPEEQRGTGKTSIFQPAIDELRRQREQVVAAIKALAAHDKTFREDTPADGIKQEIREQRRADRQAAAAAKRDAEAMIKAIKESRISKDDLNTVIGHIRWKPSDLIQIEDRRDPVFTARDKTAREDRPADVVKAVLEAIKNSENSAEAALPFLQTIAKNTKDDPEETSKKNQKHFERVRAQISESKVATIQKLQEGKAATQEVRQRIDVARAAQVAATIANAARVAAAEANSADRIVRALYATRAVTNVNVSVSGSGVVHNSYLNKAKNEGFGTSGQ